MSVISLYNVQETQSFISNKPVVQLIMFVYPSTDSLSLFSGMALVWDLDNLKRTKLSVIFLKTVAPPWPNDQDDFKVPLSHSIISPLCLALVFSSPETFAHCKPRSPACVDPRGMIDIIYKEDYYALLHTKYKSFTAHGFEEYGS